MPRGSGRRAPATRNTRGTSRTLSANPPPSYPETTTAIVNGHIYDYINEDKGQMSNSGPLELEVMRPVQNLPCFYLFQNALQIVNAMKCFKTK